MTFGEHLRAARLQRSMSQDDFAKATGLHRTLISKIERGERCSPRLETLVALARGLGLPVGRVAEWYTPPTLREN
jgi:transcriptional regulator with XRE-family HTH domain